MTVSLTALDCPGLPWKPPERALRGQGGQCHVGPVESVWQKKDRGPMCEAFLSTSRGHHRVHCGRPRGHRLRVCALCGWQRADTQRGKAKCKTDRIGCLRKQKDPCCRTTGFRTPIMPREEDAGDSASRSRCGVRIGQTVQATLAVGRLMEYSASGTPGRWAVSRETFPRLLEIKQPPGPRSLSAWPPPHRPPRGPAFFPAE